ncbi:translation initiation factor IF-2-like [Melozone crissalis]|uniref:translation initiation factor IF-2-like n=1 Tax=Melozone crissalis TaxID=40204 RepID=UPI0023DBCBD5|nr:translation initiation factor IF-2-like [Melozone crissalis]
MAARAELGGVPPSPLPSLLPASAPRGGGDCHGPIRAAGPARAVRCGTALRLSCGPCGGSSAGAAGGRRPTRRGAASELGWLQGRCEEGDAVTSPSSTVGPGERSGLPAVTRRAPPASTGCCPPELAPCLGSARFVTVARALTAGSGGCHSLSASHRQGRQVHAQRLYPRLGAQEELQQPRGGKRKLHHPVSQSNPGQRPLSLFHKLPLGRPPGPAESAGPALPPPGGQRNGTWRGPSSPRFPAFPRGGAHARCAAVRPYPSARPFSLDVCVNKVIPAPMVSAGRPSGPARGAPRRLAPARAPAAGQSRAEPRHSPPPAVSLRRARRGLSCGALGLRSPGSVRRRRRRPGRQHGKGPSPRPVSPSPPPGRPSFSRSVCAFV